MLRNLHVKNLALIDEAEVDFTEGLNILTGETGAGKSLILGSVSLALGGRYTAEMLREGADYGLVELVFQTENPAALCRLAELDIFPEDGQIIISRKLMEGRSVSRINGESVTAARVKEAAAALIDIHGQHEHQSLLYKKNHLAILDSYARGAGELKAQVRDAYRVYRERRGKLESACTDESQRHKEADFLEFEIGEIRGAGLSVAEETELEETYRRMTNGKRIAEYLEEADACLTENAAEAVGRAVRALSGAASLDAQAEELYGQLLEVESLLADAGRELRDYQESLSFSPEEFYRVEERLNEINRLKAKYGNSVEEILGYLKEQESRLAVLRDYDAYLERLGAELREAEDTLRGCCGRLGELRRREAVSLREEITAALAELHFPDVRLDIRLEETRDYTADGTEQAEFLISLNPGLPLRPLAEVASGGELSRIMLAIKTVLASQDEIGTLIFDEIDVGISGRTAQKVSEKMGLIARSRQVICITHLAQIAAMADTHFLIEKLVEHGTVRTAIRRLDAEESVQELARILGGAQITDTVRKSAREMKILAQGLKS